MLDLIDLFSILRFWFVFLIIGALFFPITSILFKNFKDKGYIFGKTIGIALISYSVFILSFLKIFKFSFSEIIFVLFLFLFLNLYLLRKIDFRKILKESLRLIIIEEALFLLALIFWSFIRGNMPNINGLEKFMDFGFVNSILRSDYFPPKDMWYTNFSINYYYFGHLITAVLLKLSGIASNIGYNLMLGLLFALTFTQVFSLVLNLFDNKRFSLKSAVASILSASLVALSGNLTTIYAFFKAYIPQDHPIVFWNLPFLPLSFPNGYWYPNATRFIQFTIHEFPLYSFVVSDLHGHVLDIPIVLLSIGLIFAMLLEENVKKLYIGILSFLLAVMYMTNAWDGIIYGLLTFLIILLISFHKKVSFSNFFSSVFILGVGFFAFSLPFSVNFKPFVSGIGVICAPEILTKMGKLGPLLFESNHCQTSPIWQLIILYGFFYFFVISFILFLKFKRNYKTTKSDIFVAFLIILSTLLILIPEIIYVKDIYPAHYRANTMFKLTYEAFIMLSLSCGYIIVKILMHLRNKKTLVLFFIPTLILLYLVFSYPIFAINSYYDNLKIYKGLDGTKYLSTTHPEDFDLINWLNINIKGQPVVIEAVGDSYTDYARISANTGLPTIMGWPVHEWLWRGTYDVVGPRVDDVKTFYTTKNVETAKEIIKKYNASYIVVSLLEKEKYPELNEENIKSLGEIIYQKGEAKLYKINF
ncbi:MAG: hypothetical protein HY344_00275 [Candidatus Levybacteria bacterium]|nr:hypothetical protein [Candidatus Levybacteria bacterium]